MDIFRGSELGFCLTRELLERVSRFGNGPGAVSLPRQSLFLGDELGWMYDYTRT